MIYLDTLYLVHIPKVVGRILPPHKFKSKTKREKELEEVNKYFREKYGYGP